MKRTWSKLDPVGTAETGLRDVRRAMLKTDRVKKSAGMQARLRVWSILIYFTSISAGSGFPAPFARDLSRSERRTRLFVMSEFPGKNNYCPKILKGNLEPGHNS